MHVPVGVCEQISPRGAPAANPATVSLGLLLVDEGTATETMHGAVIEEEYKHVTIRLPSRDIRVIGSCPPLTALMHVFISHLSSPEEKKMSVPPFGAINYDHMKS